MCKKIIQVNRLSIVILIILAAAAINIGNAEEIIIREESVFAEFDGGTITKAKFDVEFENIPMMYRSQYSTLQGQELFLDQLVINEIFYLKAIEKGIDRQPETVAAIEEALSHFYAREFIRRDITSQIEVPMADIRKFYEDYPGRFTEAANTVIQYIGVDEPETAQLVRQGFDSGTDFIDLMNQYSDNAYSKRQQGIIRNIRGTGYIQGVGRDEVLDNEIKESPVNEWRGPLHTDTGYHFFRVTERTPSRVKPLEDVRHEIESRLKPIKEHELRQQLYQDLKDKYEIVINNEALESLNLFEIRQGSDKLDQVIVSSQNPELEVTVYDIITQIQTISPQERQQLTNPEHLTRMLNNMVETNIFAHEAMSKGYEQYIMEDPDVLQIRRNTILRNLFQEMVTDYVAASPEEIAEFYNQNINSYTRNENRTVQLFMFDGRRDAGRARSRVNRAVRNEDEEVVNEIVQETLFTANNGVIRNVTRSSDIPSIGEDEAIYKAIWNTDVKGVSSRQRTEDGKFFFVRVIEHNPETIVPLEQVEQNIQNRLTAARRDERWQELQEELLEEYNVVVYADKLAHSVSARELFDLAEEALKRKRFNEAIEHYDRIIRIYSNNDDDYKALFMKAFLYAEELKNNDKAIALFQELVNSYDYADLHESAEFMIKSLRDGFQLFED